MIIDAAPLPSPFPVFSALAIGDEFRTMNGTVYIKTSANQALNLSLAIPAYANPLANESCQKVILTLVVAVAP